MDPYLQNIPLICHIDYLPVLKEMLSTSGLCKDQSFHCLSIQACPARQNFRRSFSLPVCDYQDCLPTNVFHGNFHFLKNIDNHIAMWKVFDIYICYPDSILHSSSCFQIPSELLVQILHGTDNCHDSIPPAKVTTHCSPLFHLVAINIPPLHRISLDASLKGRRITVPFDRIPLVPFPTNRKPHLSLVHNLLLYLMPSIPKCLHYHLKKEDIHPLQSVF